MNSSPAQRKRPQHERAGSLHANHPTVRQPCSSGQAPYRRLAAIGLGALLLLLAVACTTSPEKKSFGTEKLLVGAGFHYKMAQNPEQLEKLRTLPQEKLIPHEYHGKPVYVYVSADGCQCYYVGDEPAYTRFRELARDAALNASIHKGPGPGGSLFGPSESWNAYLNDLASGMIPGY